MVSCRHLVSVGLLLVLPAAADVGSALQQLVDERELAGAVTIVATRDAIIDASSVGWSDLKRRKAMRQDDLFWIASMTKPMTAVAVMMLQEDGRLSIDDAVERHLPEFRDAWVVSSADGERRTLVRAARPVTLRDLLTHTAGLDEVPAPRAHCSLAELVMA
jgi:CubicO group peptidase (beta-lactamase class C family)